MKHCIATVVLWTLFTTKLCAQGSAFTYQGRLAEAGIPFNGAIELEATLWDAATNGTQILPPRPETYSVDVSNGLFTVSLDFGKAAFTGAQRWLQIHLRTSPDPTPFTTLWPRQKITATPHAMVAEHLTGRVPEDGLAGFYTNQVLFDNLQNVFVGDGSELLNLNASQLSSGTVPSVALGNAWKIGGNAGTTPGTHFLGTTDNQPLELKVNGFRGLRLEPTPPGLPNAVIGADNEIALGVAAAFIGGGYGNRIQTGSDISAIISGDFNTIPPNAPYGMILGGRLNSVGRFSLAAGHRAKATHGGSFLWADSTDADFQSAATNEFAVRATGGARFVTAGAGVALDRLTVEGPGTTHGGVPGFPEVVARVKRTGFSHSALAIDAEASQDAVLYLAESGFARWAVRHDADQAHELDIRYSAPGMAVGLEALKLTTNGNLIVAGTINGTIASNTIASGQIADGSVAAIDINVGSFSSTFWKADGNAGTSPGTHFIGTTDNQPLEVKVNGVRALRLEPGASGLPNVIGGAANNQVAAAVSAATITGGRENTIEPGGDAGAIGGGRLNTIQAGASSSAIGGGRDNTISTNSDFSTVAGGIRNTAGGVNAPGFTSAATVGGGDSNFADAPYATIGGGAGNTNTGFAATIPGGLENVAAGSYSLAAGRRAKAHHNGAFVWADSGPADFTSTAENQFLIRARGGAGIGTASPGASLHVYATNNPTVVRIQSANGPGFGRLEFFSDPQGSLNEWRPGYIQSTDNGNFTGGLAFFVNGSEHQNRLNATEVMRMVNGRVGIGTTNPPNLLTVEGMGATNGGVIGFSEVVGRFRRTGASHTAVSIDAETGRDSVLYLAENGVTRWAMRHDADQNHELDLRYSITPASSIEALRILTNGTLITAGPVNPPSDRNVKTAFQPVNARSILEKVATLPLMTWSYTNSSNVRHVGPVAQDFHAAFGVGTDDKHIATVDADGVALAAIQGLNQRLEEKDAEIESLKQRLEDLEKLIARGNHR